VERPVGAVEDGALALRVPDLQHRPAGFRDLVLLEPEPERLPEPRRAAGLEDDVPVTRRG
jgi:hypothetical protein